MKNQLLLCLILFIINFFSLCLSLRRDSLEQLDNDALRNGYKIHNPVSSDQTNPWISGPFNKKFQFHIGQQSWLSARELCLSQNADLLTITSQEELDWILYHYKPHGKHLRDRQIQLGLLIDHEDTNQREWRWVNDQPLNTSLLQWISGEPFDHANGKERCAILQINQRKLDDVDCDLNGNNMHFYRFVCERSHEKHLKHEELNNPLWKKLEDILVFFGISSPSTMLNKSDEIAINGGDNDNITAESDYFDKVSVTTTTEIVNLDEASTTTSVISSTEESVKLSESEIQKANAINENKFNNSNPSESSTNQASESTQNPVSEAAYNSASEESTSNPTSESTQSLASESAPNKSSESAPNQPSESAPNQPSESAPNQPSESAPNQSSESAPNQPSESTPNQPSESAPIQASETTPKQASETLSTIENNNNKSIDETTLEPIEKILNFYNVSSDEISLNNNNNTTFLIEEIANNTSIISITNNTINNKALASTTFIKDETNNNGILIDNNGLERLNNAIIDDSLNANPQRKSDILLIETASVETTRTTKTDRLAKLADTLEQTILGGGAIRAAPADEPQLAIDSQQHDENAEQIQNRIHNLERIITAVQKMFDSPVVENSTTTTTTNNSTEKLAEKASIKESTTTTTTATTTSKRNNVSHTTIPNKINQLKEASKKSIFVSDKQKIKLTDSENSNEETIKDNDNNIESALNVEEDFIQAEAENKAHPNLNSGDLIRLPEPATAGSCGETAPIVETKSNTTITNNNNNNSSEEEEDEEESANKSEKSQKINNFLRSLRNYLNRANNEELENFVEAKPTNKTSNISLIKKLKTIKETDKIDKGKLSKIPTTTTTKPTTESSPIEELKKLHLKRKETEKRMKFEREINKELDELSENESHETEFPIKVKQAEVYIQTTKSSLNIKSQTTTLTTPIETTTTTTTETTTTEQTKKNNQEFIIPEQENENSLEITTLLAPVNEKTTENESETEFSVTNEATTEFITTLVNNTENGTTKSNIASKFTKSNSNSEKTESKLNNESTESDIEKYIESSAEKANTSSKISSTTTTTTESKKLEVLSNNLSNPTNEIIEAVLALHNPTNNLLNETKEYDNVHLKGLNYEISEHVKIDNITLLDNNNNNNKNDNLLNKTELKPTNKNLTKIHQNIVFPHPDYLMGSNKTIVDPYEIPLEIKERLKAEKQRVDSAYDLFQQNAEKTENLIKRIRKVDAQRLTVKQSASLISDPTTKQSETIAYDVAKQILEDNQNSSKDEEIANEKF